MEQDKIKPSYLNLTDLSGIHGKARDGWKGNRSRMNEGTSLAKKNTERSSRNLLRDIREEKLR